MKFPEVTGFFEAVVKNQLNAPDALTVSAHTRTAVTQRCGTIVCASQDEQIHATFVKGGSPQELNIGSAGLRDAPACIADSSCDVHVWDEVIADVISGCAS